MPTGQETFMTDFTAIAASYIDAWNERDPQARKAAIGKLWAPDARYTDPLVSVAGHEEIDATVAAVQQQFPGFEFRLAGPVDGHHGQCRFSWELGPAGAAAPIEGFDVAVVGPDGTLRLVLGFLDKVPAS
jgi:SnoaL-like domain